MDDLRLLEMNMPIDRSIATWLELDCQAISGGSTSRLTKIKFSGGEMGTRIKEFGF